MSNEHIVRAAIMIDHGVWSAPPPCRHHHAIWLYALGSTEQPAQGFVATLRRWFRGRRRQVRGRDQGFLTSSGRFVGRAEAKQIAVASGQYRNPQSSSARHGATHESDDLYSEDVW